MHIFIKDMNFAWFCLEALRDFWSGGSEFFLSLSNLPTRKEKLVVDQMLHGPLSQTLFEIFLWLFNVLLNLVCAQ